MISENGIALIQEFEGMSLNAYADPGTGGEPWTIGIGRAHGVKPGDTCTEEEAIKWLKEDCAVAETCVDAHVVPELTQEQRDALISFVFNLGCLSFRGSTLLRLLNAGDVAGAAQQFKRWNRAAGREMAGLTRRREAEAELFMLA